MSKFVSSQLRQIDLGDGSWIKIPEELSYKDVQEIDRLNKGGASQSVIIKMVIREWNLADDGGPVLPITDETIGRLNIPTAKVISGAIEEMLTRDNSKKKTRERVSNLTLAVKGNGKDECWVDYIMSEKFGLDWKEYGSVRMKEFLLIMQIVNSLQSQTNKK